MFKLIRNRWLHRALFAGVLIALGVGVYHFEQPTPMSEITQPNLAAICFGQESQRLVTHQMPGFGMGGGIAGMGGMAGFGGMAGMVGGATGPVQIWDLRTGAEIGRHLAQNTLLFSETFSKNGRGFAIRTETDPRTLNLLNATDNTALEIPLDDGGAGDLEFSPGGDVLLRTISRGEEQELQIYDCATGRMLAKHASTLVSAKAMDGMVLIQKHTPPARYDLEIWSLPDHRPLATVQDAGSANSSSDGKWVLFERQGGTAKWAVWSLQNRRIEAEAELDKRFWFRTVVSPDNRWVVFTTDDNVPEFLELREFPSLRRVAKSAMDVKSNVEFSPDGKWLVMDASHRGVSLIVAETPTLDVRWERQERRTRKLKIDWAFSADSRTLFMPSEDDTEIIGLAADFSEVRVRIPLPSDNGVSLKRTLDWKALLIHQFDGGRKKSWIDRFPWVTRFLPAHTDCVLVVDTNACQERFRLTGSGVSSAMLSDDGATLVTQHADGHLRCWDVDAWKPLHWPIGVPAGLAAVGVLWTWRRRRRV